MVRNHYHYMNQQGLSLEYSITGHGEPILVMHGGHSSSKEEFGYEELVEKGYMIITPSRPGYGETSKELGMNIYDTCNTYIELLEYLNIAQVHVIAISAGGPSGIHLASKFPHRVRSLILQSAVTHEWVTPEDKIYKSAKIMFHPRMEKCLWKIVRMINNLFPRYLFKKMLSSFSMLNMNDK
ncbi:alpha/beta fold hydrolase [Paenibacillus harenae]|uniref:alpha/beta fold hydrolase n=1 Tax=Paenibacillus harenae TaxID=306543 RepID=UPI00041AD6D8|nr:alpha/beta hydrolase [Paenibacillus harenae]